MSPSQECHKNIITLKNLKINAQKREKLGRLLPGTNRARDVISG